MESPEYTHPLNKALTPREGSTITRGPWRIEGERAEGERAHKIIDRAPTKGRTKGTLTAKRRTTASVSEGIGLAYEWFLELPVPVVLLVLWVGGVALLGACALLAYAAISTLVGIVAGAF
jgi:hypothetical protein